MAKSRKAHWEDIYSQKNLQELSWFQKVSSTSLDFIREFSIPRNARIIDIGGGDSLLVDQLIEQGYENISVLDVSENAINRAKERLGLHAEKVKWIVSDIVDFKPVELYDLWHDRATFHFLTTEAEIEKYIENIRSSIAENGHLLLGTFSTEGPEKCSGLQVKRYSEKNMTTLLQKHFKKVKCLTVDHITPFNTTQNFLFCSFRKNLISGNH